MRSFQSASRNRAGALLLAASYCIAETNEVTADQAVTALENTFGVTPGERRNHTKGTCAAGEFVGTAGAVPYTRSALFSGKPVPVVARFSLAGGNPKVPDTAKNARGMALEFRLPGGNLQHITMLNTPMFGAAKPQTFVDMIIPVFMFILGMSVPLALGKRLARDGSPTRVHCIDRR